MVFTCYMNAESRKNFEILKPALMDFYLDGVCFYLLLFLHIITIKLINRNISPPQRSVGNMNE